MKLRRLAISLFAVGMFITLSAAQDGVSPVITSDWPQWRGPKNGDRISSGDRAGIELDSQPPRQMWTAEVGVGFSCVVVAKNRAFTMGWTSNHGGEDTVWCFNAEDGSVLWKYSYPNYSLLNIDHGLPTPNTTRQNVGTPCVDGDRIYTLSSSGEACCLRTDTGEVIWERDLLTETGDDRNGTDGDRSGCR